MKILVTGGAGYIGSHTCIELLNKNYEVIVVDNFSNSNIESIKRISKITNKNLTFYEIDLLNKEMLEKVFEENNIEAVIHFAGFKAVGESVTFPLRYYQNNITGTLNLCEIMNKHKVYKFVFSSSATVYGRQEKVPLTENLPMEATNPYGRTKLMIEEILMDIHISNPNWHIILLRYFNPIGAHESGLIGEDPNGVPNNLIPYVTQVAIGKLDKVNVFGNDYNTHDGTGIRDYIHVTDLAKGHLQALKKIIVSKGIHVYNLGTGKGYSVMDIIKAFERVSGKSIPYKVTSRRPGDVAISYADPSKAFKELNWQAEKDLDTMCTDSWKWQKANPNGFKGNKNVKV